MSLGGYKKDPEGGEAYGKEWWPENCALDGGPYRTVRALEGQTATVRYTVRCS